MKKLTVSLIMLLLTALMAFVSVFAWFSMRDRVGANAPGIPIDGDHVTSADIGYFHATGDKTNGFTLGAELTAAEAMPVFPALERPRIVAKIDFSYLLDDNTADATPFTLTATLLCSCPDFITVTKDTGGNPVIGNAYMSNISEFTFLNLSSDKLTVSGETGTFATQSFYVSGAKKTVIRETLNFTQTADERYTVYLLIDYNQYAISRFNFLLLQQGIASSSTPADGYPFAPDLSIGFDKGGA